MNSALIFDCKMKLEISICESKLALSEVVLLIEVIISFQELKALRFTFPHFAPKQPILTLCVSS